MKILKSINKHKINILISAVILLLAILFVSCFSKSTSPLFISVGNDSAIFTFIGNSMLRGKRLYVDLFDHKGPVLFFIQYIGQLIHHGRFGIYLLQIIFLTSSLLLIYKTARLLLSKLSSFFVIIIFLFGLRYFYEGGNLSEEFSLLFSFYAVYIILKKIIHQKTKIPFIHLFLMGACVSLVFLIRANNATPILASLLTYAIYLFIEKGIKITIEKILIIFAGFATTTAIILLYFVINNSLSEMIYATFLFNFKYSSFNFDNINNLLKSGYVWWGLLSMVLCVAGGLFYQPKSKQKWILLFSTILGVASFGSVFASTTGYFHYLQMILPALVVGVILILHSFDLKDRQSGLCILGILPLAMLTYHGIVTVTQDDPTIHIQYNQKVQSIVRQIPEQDRDKVFGWDIPSSFWIEANIIPSHRFYTFQGWWGRYDRNIYQEIEQYFREDPPFWVILKTYKDIDSSFLRKFLLDNYTTITDQNYILLQLRQDVYN